MFFLPAIQGMECDRTRVRIHTSSKSILENLLKTQKLQDGEVDRRVESQTALVGTESRVVLYTETTVHLALALVVLPHHSELDDALGNGGNLEGLFVLGVLLKQRAVLERGGQLLVGLLELGL